MSLTYSSYLKVHELLDLQQPLSDGPEHDEMLFIIIHQVYELWFKEMLHEMDFLCGRLLESDHWRALHTFRRILTILKVAVRQIDILETMTPVEFLTFRHRLESASGFQSYQFRELEFTLGYKRRGIFQFYEDDPGAHAQLEKRYQAPTLWDAFLHYLNQNGHPIPAESLRRDVSLPIEASPDIQQALLAVYRTKSNLTRVCERMVDLDEGLQEWRYRHVKMVERTIGVKQGTGGSSGVQYLKGTLFKPFFPDLWAIRAEL
ncbi:MAG TPA: tryptophan 2,3-dioxygenase family protein [Anaerolineales bacterium]|jgi:tryptophan 2,3-dioxygenase|nr:tryptophan 2,3-dioxygenase family protein [Anaerolineales bacterium]